MSVCHTFLKFKIVFLEIRSWNNLASVKVHCETNLRNTGAELVINDIFRCLSPRSGSTVWYLPLKQGSPNLSQRFAALLASKCPCPTHCWLPGSGVLHLLIDGTHLIQVFSSGDSKDVWKMASIPGNRIWHPSLEILTFLRIGHDLFTLIPCQLMIFCWVCSFRKAWEISPEPGHQLHYFFISFLHMLTNMWPWRVLEVSYYEELCYPALKFSSLVFLAFCSCRTVEVSPPSIRMMELLCVFLVVWRGLYVHFCWH